MPRIRIIIAMIKRVNFKFDFLGNTVGGTGADGGLGLKVGVGIDGRTGADETELETNPGELCGGTVALGGAELKEK